MSAASLVAPGAAFTRPPIRPPVTLAEELRALPDSEFERYLATLTNEETYAMLYDWTGTWARPSQLPPPEFRSGLRVFWMVQAGRGFGKTRVGAEMVREWAWSGTNPLTHIIGPTAADTRDVMIEGQSGILAICPDHERPKYEPSKRRLTWPNGAVTVVFSADEPERLRGPQCYKLWADEIATWRYPATWDMALFGLRLGHLPQAVITTTPRPTKLVRELSRDSRCVVTRGTTHDNRTNLADAFLATIITKYEGTRLGRQELAGELLEDNPGALWRQQQVDDDRWASDAEGAMLPLPDFDRIVVAIDPAATATKDSDETGIVVVGRDRRRPVHYYVLEDLSLVASPDNWARVAVYAYRKFAADRIIGESNNGGDMVEATVRHVDPNVSYRKVTASRGKLVRAEPVAALYEQHRVHHVGVFGQLESQMTDYDPRLAEYSPDRMDALVWAMTELASGEGTHGLIEMWRERALETEVATTIGQSAADRFREVALAQKGEELKPDLPYRPATPSLGATGRTRGRVLAPVPASALPAITERCPKCGAVGLARFSEGQWACGCGARGQDQVAQQTRTR